MDKPDIKLANQILLHKQIRIPLHRERKIMSMWGLKGFKEPKNYVSFYLSLNFVITRAQIAQDATWLSSPCKYCKE